MNDFAYVQHESQTHTIYTQQEFLEGDYFANGKEHHVMKRIIITGNENIDRETLPNGKNRFRIYKNNLAKCDTTHKKAYSNMFILLGNGETYNGNKNGFATTEGSIYIFAEEWSNKTVEELKAELKALYEARTPLYFDVTLLEKEVLECTAEQIAQLDALEASQNYKNGTIVYSTDEISPKFDITYRKDLDTVREQDKAELQEQIDEIKALLNTTNTSAMLLDNMQTDLESEVE